MCLGSDTEVTEDMKNKVTAQIRENINGVSDQFIDDFLFVFEQSEELSVRNMLFEPVSQIFTAKSELYIRVNFCHNFR